MLQLLAHGDYKLSETKGSTKILQLNGTKAFAWVMAEDIGQILVTTTKNHSVDQFLSLGKYRLYEVEGEPELTDVQHLELEVGEGKWQGYLLLTGLPNRHDKRHRIIPTNEIITKTGQLSDAISSDHDF